MENQEEGTGTHKSSGMDPKTIAIISYITLIGTIIALVINNNDKQPFASFHIRQSLGLGLTLIVLGFIAIIPIIGWLVYIVGGIVLFILWIIGLMAALNGEEKTVPIMGERYQEWFKGL